MEKLEQKIIGDILIGQKGLEELPELKDAGPIRIAFIKLAFALLPVKERYLQASQAYQSAGLEEEAEQAMQLYKLSAVSSA